MATRKGVRPHIESTPDPTAEEASNQARDAADRSAQVPPARDAHQDNAADKPLGGDEAAPRPTTSVADGVAWVRQVVRGHEHAALGGIAGLAVALLVFAIGFWRTLFVCALVLAGVTLGQLLDGDPKIINLVRRILEERRGS